MKKKRKFAAAVMASALSMCCIPAIGASAAPPPSTDPRIYVELTEDDIGIRADVIMENVPDFKNCMIGINLGKSWNCVSLSASNIDNFHQVIDNDTGNHYVVMAIVNPDLPDQNHNGLLSSFYIEKTELFDLSDSGLNLYNNNEKYAFLLSIKKADGTNIYEDVYYGSPRMLEADEFMYGDVTGDGYISGSDATWALSAVKEHGGRIKVTDLYKNYTDDIKDMKAAYAADVNKDGYIDETDANIILHTYTELLSGKGFNEIDGIVGDIDVYEVY